MKKWGVTTLVPVRKQQLQMSDFAITANHFMRLLFVTRVQLPSRAAQSLQIMAMARAFHELLGDGFRLISCEGERRMSMVAPFHWEVRKGARGQWLRYGALFLETFVRAWGDKGIVIFTRDIALAVSAVLAGRRAVYEAHKQPAGRAAAWMCRLLVRSSKFKLVAISGALAEFYQTAYKLPEARVLVAHDGVFPEDYRALRRRGRGAIRKELNLALDKLLVVHTGSLYKGGAELYEHVARAGGDSVLFLHIGGSESERKCWTEHYRVLGLDNVVFLPHMPPEQARLYQMAADLLFYVTTRASPMYWCTSPLKVFEYMATGTPILGARIGSVAEVLNDGNAYCFDPDHPESIGEAFMRYRQDATLAQLKADQALSEVEEKYSWGERARKIAAFALG